MKSTTGLPASSVRLTVLSSSVCRVKLATFWFSSMGKFLTVSIGGLLAAIKFDYSRGGRQVSLHKRIVLSGRRLILAAIGLAAALPICAQYPGRVAKNAKESPELRAIA